MDLVVGNVQVVKTLGVADLSLVSAMVRVHEFETDKVDCRSHV